MRITKIKILLLIFIIAIIVILGDTAKKSKVRVENQLSLNFKNEFTGVVTKIYSQRGFFVVYKDIYTLKFTEIYSTSELALQLNLRDTIIKLPNSNYCIVKNVDKKIKVKLYNNDFIDDLEKVNQNQ